MGQFSRIERLLGSGLDEVDEQAIQKLVAGQVREDEDLDFKAELYGRGDSEKRDLAGDLAALANTRGGILILGIEERDGAAVAAPCVALSEAEELWMRQTVASNSAPHVTFNVRRVASTADGDRGFYVLEVPRSSRAPHAVRVNDALRYPRRAGILNRWVSESEVADAYRNRFAGAREQVERAAAVRLEGEADISFEAEPVWVSIALVPDSPGTMELSRRKIKELREFPQRLAGPQIQRSYLRNHVSDARAGHRRAVLEFSGTKPYGAIAHLHTDGSAYAAASVGWFTHSEVTPLTTDSADVDDELLTQSVIDSLSLLAVHASHNCGVQGPVLVETTLASRVPMALTNSRESTGSRWYHHMVDRAPIGQHTLDLDDVLASAEGLLVAARLLVTDLVQGFGLAESPQLTAAGEVRRRYWTRGIHHRLDSEATRLGIGVTDDTID